MKIDLSLTITSIIALSAVFSPIVTSLIDNHYLSKRENAKNYELAKRQALTDFIGCANNMHQHKTPTPIAKYYSALNNLYIYFSSIPNDVHSLLDIEYVKFDKALNNIVIKLSKQIKKK